MGLILVRYGEIALKGANRGDFVRRLRRNIRDCLKKNGIKAAVYVSGSRVFIETEETDAALEHVRRVFGIVSLSPVRKVSRDMEAMRESALRVARGWGLDQQRSFRVRARRADKSFPLTSPDIGRLVGGAVVEQTGARVDLTDAADLTIGVEVRADGVLIFGETIPGPGGLPLGSQGRVVALISGGIDSPVAAWMMMKRGCGVIPLHFKQSEVEAAKALDNCQVLGQYSYGWEIRPIVLDHRQEFGYICDRLTEIGAERWTCVMCKRTLLLRASQIADELGASGLVMGDSLGQVASQTLANLEAVSYKIPKPIFRPLIGLDKTEIVALGRRIGTFDVSTREAEGCAFLPDRPLTRAQMPKLVEILDRLDAPGAHGGTEPE